MTLKGRVIDRSNVSQSPVSEVNSIAVIPFRFSLDSLSVLQKRFRMNCSIRGVSLWCACAVMALCYGTRDASAALITAAKSDDLNHALAASAFFTLSSDGSVALPADNGWAPITPTQAGVVTSTTTKKSFNIAGNSTSMGGWVDGNGIPTGITLAFDAQFTISAFPAGSFLTNPGPSGSTLGQGIGITQTLTGNDDIDAGDGISVSPVTVSNVVFSGSLTEPGYTFTPGGVSGFGTRVFRSNNFTEATSGMVLTQGADTLGFGTATGSVASNLIVDNNFGTTSSIFPRQSGPYTLQVTSGTSVIKGIGLGYDVTYSVVPEPATALLAVVGLATTAVVRRRRR